MVLPKFAYKILLWTIHAVYSLVELVSEWMMRTTGRRKGQQEISAFSPDQINKLPQHIAFVVAPEEVDMKIAGDHLAHLVKWSLAMGVKHISLYDEMGVLIEMKHTIEEKLSEIANNNHTNTKSFQLKNGYTKPYFGLEAGVQFSMVRFLSAKDGKLQIVKVAQEIAKQNSNNELTSKSPKQNVQALESITPEVISTLLRKGLDFPDPELVIRLGKTPCVFGFLPWQLRLSEIMFLPLCRDMKNDPSTMILNDLLDVVGKYCRVEQRFGK